MTDHQLLYLIAGISGGTYIGVLIVACEVGRIRDRLDRIEKRLMHIEKSQLQSERFIRALLGKASNRPR